MIRTTTTITTEETPKKKKLEEKETKYGQKIRKRNFTDFKLEKTTKQ